MEANNMNVDTMTDSEFQVQYKDILESVRYLKNMAKDLKENVDNYILNELKLSEDIINDMLKYKMVDIHENMTSEDIINYLNKFKLPNNDTDYSTYSDDELRELIKNVKESSMLVISTNAEVSKTQQEATEMLDDYISHTTSKTDHNLYENVLSKLKTALESEPDSKKKKLLQIKIDTITKSDNYEFIEERLSKYQKSEVESILKILYKNGQGTYVRNRYLHNIAKLGYHTDVYKYFFNIEENFLPEKYHVFNNLFLFIYMRYIAYVDLYDEVSSFLGKIFTSHMSNLIYHSFSSTEKEQKFLDFIMHIEDTYFGEYREYFEENNTLYKNHPQMIEQRKEYENRLRKELTENIKKLDENREIDDDVKISELESIYNDMLHKLESEAIEDYRQYKEENEDDDNILIDKGFEDLDKALDELEDEDTNDSKD